MEFLKKIIKKKAKDKKKDLPAKKNKKIK